MISSVHPLYRQTRATVSRSDAVLILCSFQLFLHLLGADSHLKHQSSWKRFCISVEINLYFSAPASNSCQCSSRTLISTLILSQRDSSLFCPINVKIFLSPQYINAVFFLFNQKALNRLQILRLKLKAATCSVLVGMMGLPIATTVDSINPRSR